jgi:hypothetical protein
MEFMDAASSEYSHLDYNSAAIHLLNAELKVTKLETILKIAASKRVGNIVCSPLSSSKNNSSDNTVEDIATENATLSTSDIDSMDLPVYFYGSLLVFVLVGVIFGVRLEISDRNYQYKKRGGALL